MNRRHEPFDADERALAELLARDALPGPSPQLDARILAAARAATMPASRHPRRRWIAGIGIAASLVLAVGIAWRLRPLPPQRPAASEAPEMVSAVRVLEPASPAAADAAQPKPEARPVPVAAPMPPPPRRAPEPARKQAPPEPPIVSDEPSPMDTQAPQAFVPPPPPPPPAPVAPPNPAANSLPAAAAVPATQAAKTTAPAMRAANAPSPEVFEAARSKQGAPTLDRIETTGSRIRRDDTVVAGRLDAAAAADAAAADGGMAPSRAELDEEPPATADSPLVQEAWLQRIRELVSAGETDAARNSLAEFRRRYPKYALPEDLRNLQAP